MQFAVPQFTDVEDKLVGPFTLKQFLSLVATGGVVMFIWSIFGRSLVFLVPAIPITLIGLYIALGKKNGRPVFSYVLPFLGFVAKPKVRIFSRLLDETPVAKINKEKVDSNQVSMVKTIPESRLKKLAYLLDQKTTEEKELITQSDLEIRNSNIEIRNKLSTRGGSASG